MALVSYDSGKTADLSWLTTQTLGVLLLSTAYAPQPSHRKVSDISAFEIAVAGYSRQNLSGLVATQDDVNTRGTLTANNVTWPSLGAGTTVAWAAVYLNTGTDSTSTLIALFKVMPTPTNGSPIMLAWSGARAAGLLLLVM